MPNNLMWRGRNNSPLMPWITLALFVAFAVAVIYTKPSHEELSHPPQTNMFSRTGDQDSLSAQMGRQIQSAVKRISSP